MNQEIEVALSQKIFATSKVHRKYDDSLYLKFMLKMSTVAGLLEKACKNGEGYFKNLANKKFEKMEGVCR